MFLYLFIVYRIACDKFFGRKNMCCPPWLVATAPNLPHSPKNKNKKNNNLLQLGDLCCTLRLRLRPAPGQIDWMPFGLLSGENKKCCEWALSNWYGYEQAETETQLKKENQRGGGRGRGPSTVHTYVQSCWCLLPAAHPSLNQSLCLTAGMSFFFSCCCPLFLCPAPWQLCPQNEALAVYLWHAWSALRSPRWLLPQLQLQLLLAV